MRSAHTLAVVVSIAAIAIVGCKKKDDKDAKGAKANKGKPAPTAGKAGAATPTAKPPAPTSNIKVDEELMAAMKAVASGCDVKVDAMRVTCKAGEEKKLYDMFGYRAPKRMPLTSVGTLAVALSSDDAKLRTVAAGVMGSKFATGWGKDAKLGSVDGGVAQMLLTAVSKLGKYQARRAITGVVYAATLAKKNDELVKVLDAQADKYVKNRGYKASMMYGRMSMFPKIQELAKSDDKDVVLAAVSAASNFYKYTADEKAKLCPWAQTMLGADDETAKEAAIFEQAGQVLTSCGGKWIDALLDFGENQLKTKNKFGRRYYFVFRNLCFVMMRGAQSEAATPAQCKRNFTFLEKVVNNKKVGSTHRGMALDAIAYQRRNADSLKIMKKYANHKDPEIKKYAAGAIKMLKGYVNRKKNK